MILVRFSLKIARVVLLQLSEANSRDFAEELTESSFDVLRKWVRGLTVSQWHKSLYTGRESAVGASRH